MNSQFVNQQTILHFIIWWFGSDDHQATREWGSSVDAALSFSVSLSGEIDVSFGFPQVDPQEFLTLMKVFPLKSPYPTANTPWSNLVPQFPEYTPDLYSWKEAWSASMATEVGCWAIEAKSAFSTLTVTSTQLEIPQTFYSCWVLTSGSYSLVRIGLSHWWFRCRPHTRMTCSWVLHCNLHFHKIWSSQQAVARRSWPSLPLALK